MNIFDSYVIVDWSSSNKPNTGKDSIWYCQIIWKDGEIAIKNLKNPSTRHQAFNEIREILIQSKDKNHRTLVGFDFSYGYPSGFSKYLGLEQENKWLSIWRHIDSLIVDNIDNENNRFEVANKINDLLSGANYPFWGCPSSETRENLTSTKAEKPLHFEIDDFRITEKKIQRAQSVWKLFYSGSVGGQVLTGIPKLWNLYKDKELFKYSIVWPFETGLHHINQDKLKNKLIVHAEIYPSIIDINADNNEAKDKAQVRELASHFAKLDKDNKLGELFAGPMNLTFDERKIIEDEEGWILGVVDKNH